MRKLIFAVTVMLLFAVDAFAGSTRNVGYKRFQYFNQRVADASHTSGESIGMCSSNAGTGGNTAVSGYCLIPKGLSFTITQVSVRLEKDDGVDKGECRAILETIVVATDTATQFSGSSINYGEQNLNAAGVCVEVGGTTSFVNVRGLTCTINLPVPAVVIGPNTFGVSIETGNGGCGGTCVCTDSGEIVYSVQGYFTEN